MTTSIVKQLVIKDFRLMKPFAIGYWFGGILAIAIAVFGGDASGTVAMILFVATLFGAGVHSAMLIVEKRFLLTTRWTWNRSPITSLSSNAGRSSPARTRKRFSTLGGACAWWCRTTTSCPNYRISSKPSARATRWSSPAVNSPRPWKSESAPRVPRSTKWSA